jgi:hypothetical protein
MMPFIINIIAHLSIFPNYRYDRQQAGESLCILAMLENGI